MDHEALAHKVNILSFWAIENLPVRRAIIEDTEAALRTLRSYRINLDFADDEIRHLMANLGAAQHDRKRSMNDLVTTDVLDEEALFRDTRTKISAEISHFLSILLNGPSDDQENL